MTKQERELIKVNLQAYLNNFKTINIVDADHGQGFYVYEADR